MNVGKIVWKPPLFRLFGYVLAWHSEAFDQLRVNPFDIKQVDPQVRLNLLRQGQLEHKNAHFVALDHYLGAVQKRERDLFNVLGIRQNDLTNSPAEKLSQSWLQDKLMQTHVLADFQWLQWAQAGVRKAMKVIQEDPQRSHLTGYLETHPIRIAVALLQSGIVDRIDLARTCYEAHQRDEKAQQDPMTLVQSFFDTEVRAEFGILTLEESMRYFAGHWRID